MGRPVAAGSSQIPRDGPNFVNLNLCFPADGQLRLNLSKTVFARIIIVSVNADRMTRQLSAGDVGRTVYQNHL